MWLVSARRWKYHVQYIPNNGGCLTDGARKQPEKKSKGKSENCTTGETHQNKKIGDAIGWFDGNISSNTER